MSEDAGPPDYSELLRSPYDEDRKAKPERQEGSSDLSWKAPVAAAVLGALVVSALVIYAASGTGTADDTAATTTSVAASAESEVVVQQSDALPPGYSTVDAVSGARVESVSLTAEAARFGLTTAVAGGVDPAEVAPIDFAFWELRSGGADVRMLRQYGETGVLGNLTLEFPPSASLRQPELLAYVAEGAIETESEVVLDATVPQDLTDYRIELGDGEAITIHSLSIGDGWGHVAWSSEGDLPARVDTVVTFVGTDDPATDDVDPTRLVPPHLREISQGTGTRPVGPMYSFGASQSLVRFGEPLSGANAPTSITVTFVVRVPETIGEAVAIEVPPSP